MKEVDIIGDQTGPVAGLNHREFECRVVVPVVTLTGESDGLPAANQRLNGVYAPAPTEQSEGLAFVESDEFAMRLHDEGKASMN